MLTVIGEVLAQATESASKGGEATGGAELPNAGIELPLVILTIVAFSLIIFGVTKFFSAFKKF